MKRAVPERQLTRPFVSGLMALFLTSLTSAPSAAFFNFDNYTYGQSNCTQLKDPLNFLYEGSLGVVTNALAVTQGSPLNWTSTLGSDQWMYNGGYSTWAEKCHRQDYQRADGSLSFRNHTRLRAGTSVPNVGWVTASPMHHDSLRWCGDIADTFNGARDYAASRFDSGTYTGYRSWVGNTLGIRQCDGTITASDGYVQRIRYK